MSEKWLTKLLDERVPGWRKDVKCPVCKKKVHPLEVSRHLQSAHAVVAQKR
jgi:hypothetical protein